MGLDAFNQIKAFAVLLENQEKIQKQQMIVTLEKQVDSYGLAMLKRCLWKFKVNSSAKKIMIAFFERIMGSGKGRIFKSFHKWADLPERDDSDEIIRINQFERRLCAFANNRIKKMSFNEFKQSLADGDAVKIRSTLQLINSTMNGPQKMV